MQNENNNIDVSILISLNSGHLGFNSTFHFKNFAKYLFGGKSGRHIINESTIENKFTFDPSVNNFKIFSVSSPYKQYDAFVKKFKDEIIDYKNYRNDVVYTPFLLSINGVAVSNFLVKQDSGDAGIALYADADAQYEGLSNTYGGEESFILKIESFLKKFDDKFTEYKDFKGEERKDIERLLQEKAYMDYPRDNILFSISHGDQFEHHPDYHLHRIFRLESI